MLRASSIVGVMKMRKKRHLVDLHGLEDTVGSGIQGIMVSVPMCFITILSKAGGDLTFAQAMMMMNQRLFFAMLFVGTSTRIIGLLNLMIFKGGIQGVLIQKVLDTGVMKQTTRTKYPPTQRYLWRVRLLDCVLLAH